MSAPRCVRASDGGRWCHQPIHPAVLVLSPLHWDSSSSLVRGDGRWPCGPLALRRAGPSLSVSSHSSAEPSGTLAALSASQSIRQTQLGVQARCKAMWLVARAAGIQGNARSSGKGDIAHQVPGRLSPEPRMSQDISRQTWENESCSRAVNRPAPRRILCESVRPRVAWISMTA